MKKKLLNNKVELVCKWFDSWVTIKTLLSFATILILVNICAFLMDDPNNNAFLPILLSVISSFVLCYVSIAGLINKTKIIIGKERVIVRNYPIPFIGSREFSNNNIIEYHTRTKHYPNRIGQRPKFEIHALNEIGQQFKVLNGISCRNNVEFIRSELSKHSLVSERF